MGLSSVSYVCVYSTYISCLFPWGDGRFHHQLVQVMKVNFCCGIVRLMKRLQLVCSIVYVGHNIW